MFKKIILLFIIWLWFIFNFWGWFSLNQISAANTGDITKADYEFKVASFVPWMTITDVTDTNKNVNFLLGNIIQTMMVIIWAFSMLIMTIWAWYMILNSWQDELLSKWKTIFTSWIFALIIALTSYYLVSIIRFILYDLTN